MTTAATVHGCPVDESFDPLSPEFLADPYAAMAKLSGAEKPIFFAPSIGYYVITSYAAIEAVFRDTGTYSAAVPQAPLVYGNVGLFGSCEVDSDRPEGATCKNIWNIHVQLEMAVESVVDFRVPGEYVGFAALDVEVTQENGAESKEPVQNQVPRIGVRIRKLRIERQARLE